MPSILVVDDEKSIRVTISEFLKRDGYEVLTAENAEAALAMLDARGFDLVLTDIVMPRFSGVALLKEIHDRQSNVQVIMMTGEPTVETAVEAVRSGARDYLAKPIARGELLKAVHQAVGYKMLLDDKQRLERENAAQKLDLERLVEERTRKMRQAMLNTAYAAAAMLDLRDPYTAGHQRRVGTLAGDIGREMGLSADMVEGLNVIGCIHDVGKIMVPTDILNKPGHISPLEYELIKEHARKGFEVLRDYEMPWPVAEIVYQHHERLNGSGYPRGLRGDEIWIETYIISVADVLEAMMTHRPYRPSLGLAAALDEIISNRGVLYHPDVVDVAVSLFGEKKYQLIG